jgi:diguanylate cyclase (GGDEF)-like protein
MSASSTFPAIIDGNDSPHYMAQLVYVIDSDAKAGVQLAEQLRHFSYNSRHFNDLTIMEESFTRVYPDAIVFSINASEEHLLAHLQSLRAGLERPIPVLALAAQEHLKIRLAAVRAHCKAFFTKPVDVGRLVETLSVLTVRLDDEPYRVLLVDDDETMGRLNGMILQAAKFKVQLLHNPETLLEAIANFDPELILMDVYLQECTGDELAALIRQHHIYSQIPLIYLSGEEDLGRQLEAIRSGGADFLTKPVQPNQLIATVTPLIRHYRDMRTAFYCESVTGLPLYNTFMEHCRLLLEKSQTLNKSFACALLSVDDLEAVNREYGRSGGDVVLSNLSMALKNKFRWRELLGRYQGSVALLLPTKDAVQAFAVVDVLRQDFACIEHQHKGRFYHVTLSAGIAHFPACRELGELLKSAHNALMQAKVQGNCVVCAENVETLA